MSEPNFVATIIVHETFSQNHLENISAFKTRTVNQNDLHLPSRMLQLLTKFNDIQLGRFSQILLKDKQNKYLL